MQTVKVKIFENLHPGRSLPKAILSDLKIFLRVKEKPNRVEKVAFVKTPSYMWMSPECIHWFRGIKKTDCI